jgi:amino acid transporter
VASHSNMPTEDEDRAHLHSLGYAQELKRGMGAFSNFAISFSIISILAGGFTGFWIGAVFGGPLVITIGWIIVGGFSMLVGMSMGEICSAYPTAGGLYFWSAKLARSNGPIWSWFTGWFNFIGQIGVIASVDYALAKYVVRFINLYSTDMAKDPILTEKAGTFFVMFLVMLFLHGVLNTFGVKLVKTLGDVSVWWHVIGVAIIFVLLFSGPDVKQPVSYLFEYQNNGPWVSTMYTFFLGFLLAQYTITGYDASAHVSEETVGARVNAPKAIVRSIYVSAIAALILNIGFLLVIPNGADGKDRLADLGGIGILGPVNIAQNVLSPWAVKLFVLISMVGQFFCGMASVTANSRMVYAFSRDGGLPGSKLWHQINPKTRTPTNAVWLGVAVSALVGALSLIQRGGVETAFFALTGIAVIGLYISYIIPVYLRLRNPDFQQGPWNLKGSSQIVGWLAVAWVVFISVLFCLPLFKPFWPIVGSDSKILAEDGSVAGFKINNFNFTGPLILISFVLVGVWWAASAKKWFTGPKVMGSKEELLAIERELEALG